MEFKIGKDIVEIRFDNEPQCCEVVGMYIVQDGKCGECHGYTLGNYILHGLSCDTEEEFPQFKPTCEHDLQTYPSDEELTFANYTIPTEKGTVNVVCYNISNGYYSHDTQLLVNDKVIFDVAI